LEIGGFLKALYFNDLHALLDAGLWPDWSAMMHCGTLCRFAVAQR
jgi:hypothetical protein